MNNYFSNESNEEIVGPCVFVEFIDRDFDDSDYCNPGQRSGEMQILNDARPPEDLLPAKIAGTPERQRFTPEDESTWLLCQTNPAEYFAGMRSCLADDDQLAFPPLNTRTDKIYQPGNKAISASISGTMPKPPLKSQKLADLGFAASTLKTSAPSSAANATKSGETDSEIQKKTIGQQVFTAGKSVENQDVINAVLGFRPGHSPDAQEQFKRVFPAGFKCHSCQQPLNSMSINCHACGKASGISFTGIKHITIGVQNADWLEYKLSTTRLKFGFLFTLLIAIPAYCLHNGLVSTASLPLPFISAAVILFFWRLFALFFRKRSAIRAKRQDYLQSHPNIMPEIRECILKGRYDYRMSPLELELINGLQVVSDVKNNNLIFFIGEKRR